MAAERYSTEVLRMFYGPIENQQTTVCIFSDAIRNLPPELRELILKEYISIKMKQREELDWKEVHKELGANPFCLKREMFVKIKLCLNHTDCEVSGLCESCFREGVYHNVFQEFNEYNCYRRFSILWEDEVEHAWVDCILRGLNPIVELRDIYFSDSEIL